MQIKTLENIPVAEITAVFNEAFDSYFIPLRFTEETMAAKIKMEGIRPELSVGAFEDNKLVGFILHGSDSIDGVGTIYNAGTGVIPRFRGQKITEQLYHFCIPFLKERGFRHHILEVIENNLQAMRVYRRVGFCEVRKLNAFRTSSLAETDAHFTIKEMNAVPQNWKALYEMLPAWQNSSASIERDKASHKIAGAFIDEDVVGVGVFLPSTGRVKQCFVLSQHRRKGVAKDLFHYMLQKSATKQLVVTNIDESYEPANEFLKAIGFQNFLGLYEMKLEVK